MTISEKAWVKYIARLSAISKTAARRFTAYLNDPKHDVTSKAGRKAATDYAAALAKAYGESAAAAACEMYDAVATASKASVHAALPAPTPTYGEVAKTVNGMLKHNYNNDAIGASIGRLVKRTEADTTLKNSLRDGAYFAWVPHGDTCPFCIMLASNGWQKASKKTIRGDHAEHIHANCDCTFAIQFDGHGGVEGYDPDKYREIYDNAVGDNWKEKLRSMERNNREAHKNEINARKRELYAEKKGREHLSRGKDVLKEYLQDATPRRGNIDFDNGFNAEDRPREVETAQLVFKQLGGDFVLLAEKDGQKNPDYEWIGRLWDLKSITSEKAANSAVKSGMKQIRTNPGGVMLNFGNIDFSMDELKKVIDLRMAWYPNECADIMIISKGKIIKVLRY